MKFEEAAVTADVAARAAIEAVEGKVADAGEQLDVIVVYVRTGVGGAVVGANQADPEQLLADTLAMATILAASVGKQLNVVADTDGRG